MINRTVIVKYRFKYVNEYWIICTQKVNALKNTLIIPCGNCPMWASLRLDSTLG